MITVSIGAACGGGGKAKPDGGGGAGGSFAGTGGSFGGAGGSAGGGLAGCLDTPGALDRPPSGQLPCELIPPGLRL
jgi:hypothetical protein